MTKADQLKIARALRAARPYVIPGSNAIVNDTERKVWYGCVTEVSKILVMNAADADKFFDAAGVPT